MVGHDGAFGVMIAAAVGTLFLVPTRGSAQDPQMVEVGGRQMQVRMSGIENADSGSPVVVFEAQAIATVAVGLKDKPRRTSKPRGRSDPTPLPKKGRSPLERDSGASETILLAPTSPLSDVDSSLSPECLPESGEGVGLLEGVLPDPS